MPKYSRTKRYEDLRRRMQSEGDKDLSRSDLSEVNAHLAKDVQSPVSDAGRAHDPIHQRRYSAPIAQPTEETPEAEFNSSILRGSERSEDFDNEYVREFLKEAKQYSVDHGNAYTTNTDLNLLRILKEGQPEKKAEAPKPAPSVSPAPSKPYPDAQSSSSGSAGDDTYGSTSVSDFLDSLDSDDSDQAVQQTQSMTREDIAAEVQNMIRNAQQPARPSQPAQTSSPSPITTGAREVPSSETVSTTQLLNTGVRNSIAEAVNSSSDTTRRQLLQETTQMRAQLDDYQDNLTEVSDKMKRTNQILNVVLIVLIIALSVVLVVVIYWVLQSQGVLG